MAKNFLIYICIILLSLLSVSTLFHSGLIPTHDGEYHIIRFYEFYSVLKSGVFYPRIAPDLNYGFSVPLFNFVYPLPNYIASFFHIFGLSFIDSFKANLIAATLIGAVGMYLWSKLFWGRFGGLISSVVYTFAPYRLLDIYVRGSVGEVWALAVFPYVLFIATILIKTKEKKYIGFLSIGIALLIFSHNILALLFFTFFITYVLFLYLESKDYKSITYIFSSIALGLGLSAIFWLPAIIEKQYVRGLEIFSVERHFVELYQLLIPSWGSGFSGETTGNELSFQIGMINCFIILLSVLLLIKNKKNFKNAGLVMFCLFWIGISVYLMLSYARVFWSTVPLMNFFQFPWRLLSIVILVIGFLSGIVSEVKFRIILGIVLILCSIIFTYTYVQPAYYLERTDEYYTSRSNFIHGTNSPGNVFNTIWFDSNKKTSILKLDPDQHIELNNIIIQPQSYLFNYTATQSGAVLVNTAYFHGWTALSDGKVLNLDKTKEGLMKLTLPKGTARVEILFADTIERRVASEVSFLSLLVIVLICIKYTYYENRN